jgi:hypothetical protein
MRKLAAICADLGVEILPTTASVRAAQTTARATLQDILAAHGEGHLIQTLRTFVETDNRTRARIESFGLYAVSDLMLAYPAWANSGLRWLEVFDRIDIAAIQRQAKANRAVVPQRWGVGTLLYIELSAAFAQKPDVAPPRKTARQEREELTAKKAGIVERRIELGRELAELRDVTPNNRRFGAIGHQRIDLHGDNEVSEMIRVARVYGGRSEIYRAVGWRALVELASQATSDEERQMFEARILAGEPTNGVEQPLGLRTPKMLLDQFASGLEHDWRGRRRLVRFKHQKCLLVDLMAVRVGDDFIADHGLNHRSLHSAGHQA